MNNKKVATAPAKGKPGREALLLRMTPEEREVFRQMAEEDRRDETNTIIHYALRGIEAERARRGVVVAS